MIRTNRPQGNDPWVLGFETLADIAQLANSAAEVLRKARRGGYGEPPYVWVILGSLVASGFAKDEADEKVVLQAIKLDLREIMAREQSGV